MDVVGIFPSEAPSSGWSEPSCANRTTIGRSSAATLAAGDAVIMDNLPRFRR